jgi:hypothetical protein
VPDELDTMEIAEGLRLMVVFGSSFVGLLLLPVDLPYWLFALLITLNGVGVGVFRSPSSSSIMGSVPARHRGARPGSSHS